MEPDCLQMLRGSSQQVTEFNTGWKRYLPPLVLSQNADTWAAICLPQSRRETIPFPKQMVLEQDSGLSTRAGSCTGFKETMSCADGRCRDTNFIFSFFCWETKLHLLFLLFLHSQQPYAPQDPLQMGCEPWTVLLTGSSPSLGQDFPNSPAMSFLCLSH